jgi:hypothetical protein
MPNLPAHIIIDAANAELDIKNDGLIQKMYKAVSAYHSNK